MIPEAEEKLKEVLKAEEALEKKIHKLQTAYFDLRLMRCLVQLGIQVDPDKVDEICRISLST